MALGIGMSKLRSSFWLGMSKLTKGVDLETNGIEATDLELLLESNAVGRLRLFKGKVVLERIAGSKERLYYKEKQ